MPDVDLSGQVEHHLWLRRRKDVGDACCFADVGNVQMGAELLGLLQVRAFARCQVVEDRHPVSTREQRVDQVRPDEAGPAGDETPHGEGSLEICPGRGA